MDLRDLLGAHGPVDEIKNRDGPGTPERPRGFAFAHDEHEEGGPSRESLH